MTQELEENENGFFGEENLRYIHLFMNLMSRRHDSAVSLREHTMQVRDLYNSQLDVRQNRTMTLLIVVIFISAESVFAAPSLKASARRRPDTMDSISGSVK